MTAKGVRATLICDWEVFGKTFDGEALRPMREFGKDFDGTFDINPGVTKFVDIAVRRVVTQGMNGHEFDTHLRIAPADRAAFHIGTHEIIGLTIQVSAHDHPPQIIRFDLYYEPIRQFFDVAVIQKRLRGRLSAKQDDEPAEVKPYQLPY
jgi:hypothetical protein